MPRSSPALVIAVTVLLSAALHARAQNRSAYPPGNPAAAVASLAPASRAAVFPLLFTETSFDAGDHLQSERQISHTFSFTNRSHRTVTMAVRGPCGVTVTLHSATLAPHESGAVSFTLQLQNRSGLLRKWATIYEVGQPDSFLTLHYHATVIPDVQFDPPARRFQVEEGASATLRWTVTGLGDNFAVTAVRNLPPHVCADVSTPVPTVVAGRAARRVSISLTVHADAPRDFCMLGCNLTVTGGHAETAFLPARICVVPPILAPSFVLLSPDHAPDGPGLLARITLRPRDAIPFHPPLILATSTSGPAPSIDWTPTIDNGVFVVHATLRAPHSDANEPLSGTIVIHSATLREPLTIPYAVAPKRPRTSR